MDGTRGGRLRMWLTETAEADQIVELCSDLTAGGERLLVLDAGDLLTPRRMSRLRPAVAASVQVLRMPADVDTASFISSQLTRVPQIPTSVRILLAGILDRLAGRETPARDTARELGRIKAAIATLLDGGFDITIVCRIESGLRSIGPRAYFVSSLCAMAHEINRASDTQQDVNGASAAIA